MTKLSIILIIFTLIFLSHSCPCSITCLTPSRNNMTIYCPDNYWATCVCYKTLPPSCLCTKTGHIYNTTDPDVISWSICE